MNKTTHRFLAILAVILMVLSILPAALAETLAFPSSARSLADHWDEDPNAIDFFPPEKSDCTASLAGIVYRIGTGCKSYNATKGGKDCVQAGCQTATQTNPNPMCGGGYGNFVILQHPNNTSTVYAHLYSVDVTTGQSVVKGQKLGSIGSTGFSSTPHLHFELYFGSCFGGKRVDARPYFSKDLPEIPPTFPGSGFLSNFSQTKVQDITQTGATIVVTFDKPYLIEKSSISLGVSDSGSEKTVEVTHNETVSELRYNVEELFGACAENTNYDYSLNITSGYGAIGSGYFKTLATGTDGVVTLIGDADLSGSVDLNDLVSIVNYIVKRIPCKSMANADIQGFPGVEIWDLWGVAFLIVNQY